MAKTRAYLIGSWEKKHPLSPKLRLGLGLERQQLIAARPVAMNNSQNKISVALCTYNGERFLRQQLESIQQQSRLPDELVVCDDRSRDQTVAIVREFATSVSFPVVIVQNPETLGSSRNFEKAIRLCTGDLIALSDQDDIWYPNRLQRCRGGVRGASASGSGLL